MRATTCGLTSCAIWFPVGSEENGAHVNKWQSDACRRWCHDVSHTSRCTYTWEEQFYVGLDIIVLINALITVVIIHNYASPYEFAFTRGKICDSSITLEIMLPRRHRIFNNSSKKRLFAPFALYLVTSSLRWRLCYLTMIVSALLSNEYLFTLNADVATVCAAVGGVKMWVLYTSEDVDNWQ